MNTDKMDILDDILAEANKEVEGDERLDLFKDLVLEQFNKEKLKKQLEEQAEDLGREIADLAEHRIPELAAELGIADTTIEVDGVKLKVSLGTVWRLTLPNLDKEPERRKEAFDHLRELGLDGVISNQVIVSFEKGQDEKAAAVLEELRDQGLAVAQKEDVHYQTLNATLRTAAEQAAEAGEPLALDPLKFGGFTGLRSTVKQPKK